MRLRPERALGVLAGPCHLLLRVQRGGALDGGRLLHAHPLRARPGTYDPGSQIWSDWLYPFCVYGFGAVACVLVLFPAKNRLERHFGGRVAPLLASFAANTLACTLIELAMGLVLNRPGPDGVLPLWDYSDMFCNFMGQVCLQNALAFGAAATLMTWVVHPKLAAFLRQVPEGALNLVSAGMGAGFCLLLLP